MTDATMPTSGAAASHTHTVTEADTAEALQSGDLPVLATPRLLAWAEHATCAAIAEHVSGARSSVGTRVQVEHLRPSPVDAVVTVQAELVHVDGRLLQFQVTAQHADGTVVGHGEVTRVVVDRERFMSRLA